MQQTSTAINETLTRLAAEHDRKVDFVADTRDLSLVNRAYSNPDRPYALIINGNTYRDFVRSELPTEFNIRPEGHRQLAAKTGITHKDYARMQEHAPDLLATNVNHWLRHDPKRAMVRDLDGVRAVLSSRYRRIDHRDILNAAAPRLEANGYTITGLQANETRMVLRAELSEPVELRKVGDVAKRGIVITNSENGHGSFLVGMFVRILSCLNGMQMDDHRMRRHHVGTDQANGFLSESTMQADDAVFLMKAADLIDAFADRRKFDKFWDAIDNAGSVELAAPIAAAEVLTKRAGLNKAEGVAVRDGLVKSADFTVWGAIQALTAFAHKGDMSSDANLDRRSELEQTAGRLLMDKSAHAALSAAA